MLITARQDAVSLLTLNRPEKRNSLHPDLIVDLSSAIATAANDKTINVLVITGAGPSFCAGLDLFHLLGLDIQGKTAYLKSLFDLFEQIYTLPQPVIAAVNGPAMAGGFDLAAFCDLRFCSLNAKFAETEVLLGMTQILYPLYKVIGLSRAKELAFTGEAIAAEEAYRIGLANRLFPHEELLEKTMKFAATLASRPREALFETKRLSRELIDLDTSSAFRLMFDVIGERLRSKEHRLEAEKYVAGLKQRK